jgi:hypothetical protein
VDLRRPWLFVATLATLALAALTPARPSFAQPTMPAINTDCEYWEHGVTQTQTSILVYGCDGTFSSSFTLPGGVYEVIMDAQPDLLSTGTSILGCYFQAQMSGPGFSLDIGTPDPIPSRKILIYRGLNLPAGTYYLTPLPVTDCNWSVGVFHPDVSPIVPPDGQAPAPTDGQLPTPTPTDSQAPTPTPIPTIQTPPVRTPTSPTVHTPRGDISLTGKESWRFSAKAGGKSKPTKLVGGTYALSLSARSPYRNRACYFFGFLDSSPPRLYTFTLLGKVGPIARYRPYTEFRTKRLPRGTYVLQVSASTNCVWNLYVVRLDR